MSHLVTIETEVRDKAAMEAACRRLGLESPLHGTYDLFEGKATGYAVKLPGWSYPVVCDIDAGKIKYDNFGGRWGEQKHLNAFLCNYAAEKVKAEARRKGHRVTETVKADGSIRLTLTTN